MKTRASVTRILLHRSSERNHRTISNLFGFGMRRFSQYENYNIKSHDYDKMRVPIGLNIISQSVSEICSGDYAKLNVLDAGCGTGNYIQYFYELGAANVYGIELNDGMYSKSFNKHKEKIKAGTVHLEKRSLLNNLPFYDNTFNVVCINQVLHHLDTDTTRLDNYKNIRFVLLELWRCLEDGGILLINHSTPIQIVYGVWYHQLVPNSTEIYCTKLPTKQWIVNELHNIGFGDVESHVIYEPLWRADSYYDLKGIFSKERRNTDSFWCWVDEQELKNAQNAANDITKTQRSTNKFIEQCENLRQKVGQSTTFVAYK
eukprot:18302_1